MEEPIWEHSPNSTSMDWEWDETSFTDLDRREFIKALSFTRAPSYHPIFSPYMSRLLIRVRDQKAVLSMVLEFCSRTSKITE